jgi:organic radical activating enzyme
MPIREVTANIESTGVDHVVITGGEPLLQMAELEELCSALLDCGLTCEIETNGTRAPTQRLSSVVQQFNVSPKLANSGTKRDDRLKPDVLAAFCEKGAAFKFVARDMACLDEIEEIQREVGIPNQQMWVMPEGRSAGELQSALNNVTESVIGRGWNLTTRLHVLLWGDERGR